MLHLASILIMRERGMIGHVLVQHAERVGEGETHEGLVHLTCLHKQGMSINRNHDIQIGLWNANLGSEIGYAHHEKLA